MSILIKGMEMPEKTYAHCMLIKDIDGSVQLHVCTRNSEEMSEWKEYGLVPIPPHGRLIDADELPYHKWPVGEDLYGRGWNDAIDAVCENAEIVIEEEDMSYNNIYERLMCASENNDYSKYLRDLLREAASSIGNMEEIIKSLAPTIFTPED